MTFDFNEIRRFREEVPLPGGVSWYIGRAALREAIQAEGMSAERSTYARALVRRRPRRRRLTAGLTLIVALTASAGIAVAAAVLLPDLTSPATGGRASSAPTSISSSFSALRRPRQAADVLPVAGIAAMTTMGAFGPHYGVNPNLSRLVGIVDGAAVWLVPGRTGSCMYGPGGGGSVCGPTGAVAAHGLQLALIPVNGGARTLIGIVPDGATVTATNIDGSPTLVARSGNAYSISGDPSLGSLTIRVAGQRFTTPAPGAAHTR